MKRAYNLEVLPGGHHLEIPPTSNVLSLVGVVMTENRFAMVSEWMTNGNINQFTKAHPDANRFGLVSSSLKLPVSSAVVDHRYDRDSWQMLRKV